MKIGILLPSHFDVASLCRVRELCRILLQSSPLEGGPIELAVGLPERPESEWRRHERRLREGMPEVIVRHLKWETVPAGNAVRMFAKHGLRLDLSGIHEVLVPRDWGWNFTDCDLWINFADTSMGAVLPLKPVAHYVSDLAMRIVPYSFGAGVDDPFWQRQVDSFRLWRQGALVTVTDQWTADDVVGYAGVRRENVVQLPSLSFSDEPLPHLPERELGGWIWTIEANPRFDIRNALAGLQIYVREGGTHLPTIACQNAAPFSPGSHHPVFAGWDASALDLWSELEIVAYPDFRTLSRLLNRAQLLWSSEIAGGDGFSLALAARHGLRFLGMDFPAHRQLAEKCGHSIALYAESDPLLIADALHAMEALGPSQSQPLGAPESPAIRRQQYGFLIDRLLERVRD